jgi:[protein-PII] uridylyltransferase
VATTEAVLNRTDSGIDEATLRTALRDGSNAVAKCRTILDTASAALAERFFANEFVDDLVRQRATTVDHVIECCWDHFASNVLDATDLVAVGGYGRGELHPESDIDLLVLIESTDSRDVDSAVSDFLTFLWDIGLEVGHSVRTLGDCESQAAKDVTVVTTLMEARLLRGPGELFAALPERISRERMWSSREFFEAKVAEQAERHHRYHDTAYNLEPNVKSSPGGLRDIQMIMWIARRHLGITDLGQLVDHGLLTPGQLRILMSGRSFLWRIRFALHLLTGRAEDRLLFDHQVKLAQKFGYEDATYTLAVEQLMQRYYRTVMELSRLNEMLLQLFEESILLDKDEPATPLGKNFQARHGYIESVDDNVFDHEPSALLEIFLLLAQNPDLKGVNAHTIALIKQRLWLIDEEFRQNPRHHRLFLEILRSPHGVSRTLRRMNTYGVLGLYVPAFGRVVGRMQYDLFHVYTVDAHTLFVVENLRRMALSRFDDELPHCSEVMQGLAKPEIVYLAALFHDIAKGRGGDHSELGAVDAEAFCLEHGMSGYDARLVAWLVRHHLLLSLTAQKKDLNDPNVIMEFAKQIGDKTHLDYLYALTVADVRGTNPNIWNSWKDSLFLELYQETKRALRRGVSNAIDQDELISATQSQAQELLSAEGVSPAEWERVWSVFSDEYFLRHRPVEIAWHTQMLAAKKPNEQILVDVNETISDVLTVVTVYAPSQLRSFARATAAMDQLGLNVVDARILPLLDDHSLDTYFVLDSDGEPISDRRWLHDLRQRLLKALTAKESTEITVTRRAPRRVRVFSTPVSIQFAEDTVHERTIMEVIAGDRPGLLFRIGAILESQDLTLKNAKITTIGERAEDVFYISTENNLPLDAAARERLDEALRSALSDPGG